MKASEVRLEIVSLLIKSPLVEHASNSDIIERADSLTSFILNGAQKSAVHNDDQVVQSVIKALDSDMKLTIALRRWLAEYGRFLVEHSSNHHI